MNLSPLLSVSLLTLSALLLSSCEGDARYLTEPVEASRLNLGSLSIVPPSGSLLPLTVNPNEEIAFDLTGKNNSGQDIDIAATNRRWSVSDASMATINDNGVFTGLVEGEVDIYVLVGSVQAPPFTIDVSFGVLKDIGEIEGSATLQPCIAQTYSTSGIFTDDSPRALSAVSWSIEPPESGSLTVGADENGNENLSVILAGTTSGAITLTATSEGISRDFPLSIDDSLEAIVLREGLSLPANGTLQLDARGRYAGTAEGIFTDITNAVAWSIAQGENQATVANTAGNKGLVSGVAEGTALVQAACGDIAPTTTVTITPPVTQLVAEDGTDVELSVGGIGQLRISTGSIYDEDLDVTDSANWEVVGTDKSVVSVSNASGAKGEVAGLSRGDDIIVRATYNDRSIDFNVDVN